MTTISRLRVETIRPMPTAAASSRTKNSGELATDSSPCRRAGRDQPHHARSGRGSRRSASAGSSDRPSATSSPENAGPSSPLRAAGRPSRPPTASAAGRERRRRPSRPPTARLRLAQERAAAADSSRHRGDQRPVPARTPQVPRTGGSVTLASRPCHSGRPSPMAFTAAAAWRCSAERLACRQNIVARRG